MDVVSRCSRFLADALGESVIPAGVAFGVTDADETAVLDKVVVDAFGVSNVCELAALD